MFVALSVFSFACSSEPKSPVQARDDLSGHLEYPPDADMAVKQSPDLSVGDLGLVIDASVPDLKTTIPADLSVPIDLAVPRDLAPFDVDAFPCGPCSTGTTCGMTVNNPLSGTTQPLGWSFNTAVGVLGGAFFDTTNQVAVLTDDLTSRTGSIIYQNPIATDAFNLTFDFRITHAGTDHADGMGFVLMKYDGTVVNGYTAVGGAGGSLGMVQPLAAGASHPLNGYAVELDGYDNDNPSSGCGETVRGEHINIDTLAPCATGSNGTLPTPVGTAQAFTLSDGAWHTAIIKLSSDGKMSVSIQTGANVFPILLDVPLPGFVSGDAYFYGFTGSTGGFSERHEVRNFSLTFPSQRCL